MAKRRRVAAVTLATAGRRAAVSSTPPVNSEKKAIAQNCSGGFSE